MPFGLANKTTFHWIRYCHMIQFKRYKITIYPCETITGNTNRGKLDNIVPQHELTDVNAPYVASN